MTIEAELIENIRIKSEALINLGNIPDLYKQMDKLNVLVKQLYPHIDCNEGCSKCCVGTTSVPVVSPREWELIYRYIIGSPDEFKESIIKENNSDIEKYSNIFKKIHEILQIRFDKEKLLKLAKILPELKEHKCVFLRNDRCSIYDVRPAKCRAHGTFLVRYEDKTQIHACFSEIEKFEKYFKEKGGRLVTMPFWNNVEYKLAELNLGLGVSTLIPIWIKSHIKDDKFQDFPNLVPDFSNFL